MNKKIIIVSEKRNAFYMLTDLIQEMAETESMTEQQCIDYFMEGLEGSRCMTFPSYTPTSIIREWITQDMGMSIGGDDREVH